MRLYLLYDFLVWECRHCREFDLSIFDLLIFSIFKKDCPWSNRSRWSLKKINSEWIDLVDLWITKNDWFDQEKKRMFVCFWQFSPFLCQKIKTLPSIFDLRSFLKIDGIDLFSSIFEKSHGIISIFFKIKSIFLSHKTIDSTEKLMIEFPTKIYLIISNVPVFENR